MADEILGIIGGNTEKKDNVDSDSDELKDIEILSVSDNTSEVGISDFLETKSEAEPDEWKAETKSEPGSDADIEQFLVAKSPSLMDKNDSDNESDEMELTKMLRPITPELENEPEEPIRPNQETLQHLLQEKFIKSLVCP